MTKLMTVVATTALLALGVNVTPAQTAVSGTSVADLSRLSQGAAGDRGLRNSAAALMRQRVDEVNWDETPFEEVIDWLKGLAGDRVNVIARWTALGVESVDEDSFITLQLKHTNVAEVLREVFDQLVDDDELALRASGNMLKISTKTDFGRRLVTRVYDLTDVLFRVPNLGEAAPEINLRTTTGGGGGSSGGGRTVFGGGGGSGSGGGQEEAGVQAEEDLEEELDDLADTIKAVVSPLSWATVAGATRGAPTAGAGRGTIETHHLLLIVVNTVEVHEQIAGFFGIGQ